MIPLQWTSMMVRRKPRSACAMPSTASTSSFAAGASMSSRLRRLPHVHAHSSALARLVQDRHVPPKGRFQEPANIQLIAAIARGAHPTRMPDTPRVPSSPPSFCWVQVSAPFREAASSGKEDACTSTPVGRSETTDTSGCTQTSSRRSSFRG